MRDFLFRGKRLDSGEWVEGSLSLEYYKKHGCVMILPNEDECYKVEPNTVCEYTGLIDKNGKKIFEGDIVKSNISLGTVEFTHGQFIINDVDDGIQEMWDWCNEKVIGNIHDNPELLKGE